MIFSEKIEEDHGRTMIAGGSVRNSTRTPPRVNELYHYDNLLDVTA
jgi:hypothetical protein